MALPFIQNLDVYEGQDYYFVLTGSPLNLAQTGSYTLSGEMTPQYNYPTSGNLFYILDSSNLTTDGTNITLYLSGAQTFLYPGGIGNYEIDMVSGQYIFPLFVGYYNSYPSIRYESTAQGFYTN